MTDTPDHIKEIQLQLWLSKSPMERLRQMMVDNESLFSFWRQMGKKDADGGLDAASSSKVD
ncbi:hypothetical protein [Dyadobacter pollutisoli]|jgi:hypothetical protein|uniref:Uncharacterized protein n=1 Tax=Dyadobacter pollutisoli TaxID=2910158 RepID=A0A9E8NEK8_9BACT|nr:hypothetical protein [Dyadobacter pollutisoli]WAC12714.1 hypothetical protein ON006_01865 [Dyadobacter pollutisoli]